MKEEYKTKEQLVDELAEMHQRLAELGATDTKRVLAEEKTEHLNLVLRAIRNVNQLITRERDRDRLLQGACETLIETRGYHSAWSALLDETGGPGQSGAEGLVTIAEAGLGEDFSPLLERLKRDELPDCGRKALKQSGSVVIKDPFSTCADCPLLSIYAGGGAMTIQLKHGDKVYGLLSVSMPGDVAADEKEQALFEEVAGDIAFALYSIELERERKRAEEALRESEERFRLAVEAARDGLWENSADHTRDFFSDRMFTMLGYEPMDPVHAFDFFNSLRHPDDVENFETNYNAMNKPGHDSYSVEMRQKAKDGTWRHILSRGKCVERDEKGRPVRIVGTHTDITDLKRAEEALKEYSERLEEMVEERTKELRDAQETLVRQEKLAVLGQLAGGVGHELRNPLGAISNAVYFLNMVLEEPDPEIRETVEILEKEVKTSETIISSLLDFARAKPPTRQKVNVNHVVQEALSRTAVPENVEVVSQLDEALPIILADPDQLVQVFGNIILNATQAMGEGGRLVVKTEVPSPEWVAVSFADTGLGIPEENLDKLFEPLFTTKAKGVGLGLAVTKTLVEGHEGTIEVESELRKGSTFTVRLPIHGKENK
jgi:PAS domain S-box-containing protein